MQLLVGELTELWLAEEVFHHVEPVVYLPLALQREYEPAAQHSSAHRRDRLVNDVEQRGAVFL